VDANAEDILSFLLEPDKVEQSPSRVEFHEKVDVALDSLISSSDRSEYPKFPHTVPLGRTLESLRDP
jgi:hypothetical protein